MDEEKEIYMMVSVPIHHIALESGRADKEEELEINLTIALPCAADVVFLIHCSSKIFKLWNATVLNPVFVVVQSPNTALGCVQTDLC